MIHGSSGGERKYGARGERKRGSYRSDRAGGQFYRMRFRSVRVPTLNRLTNGTLGGDA